MLEAGRVKEAWDHLTWWYRQVWGKQAHPTREVLDQESTNRAELYICRLPVRLRVPILVHPEAVNDDITEESEIEIAVRGMKVGRSGAPPGMREEDLKGWRKDSNHKKDP